MYVWIAETLHAIFYKEHTQLSLTIIPRKSCTPTQCNFLLNDEVLNQGITVLIIKET